MKKKFILYVPSSYRDNRNTIRLVSIAMSTSSRITGIRSDEEASQIEVETEQEVVEALLVLFPMLRAEEDQQTHKTTAE